MKDLKKAPRKQLEKFSTVFMQLGLVLTMFVVYIIIEHQTKVKTATLVIYDSTDKPYEIDFYKPIIYKKVEVKKPVEKLPKPKVSNNLSEIKKVDELDPIETVIDKPIDNKPQVLDIDKLKVVDEGIEIDPNDDPKNFLLVEEAPVYRGCEGLSKEENKKCFVKKITKHVQRYFNSSLSEDLGLKPGKHRIYTKFVIDKSGEIIDVRVNAPRKRLKKEVQRIVDKIPLFTPGKQQGKPVKVKYTLPITFYVE